MKEKLIIALGGNALQSGKAEPTAEARQCYNRNVLVADIQRIFQGLLQMISDISL